MPAPKSSSVPNPLLEWPLQAGKVAPLLEMMEAKLQQRRRRRMRTGGRIAGLLVLAVGALWLVPYLRDTAALNTASAERHTFALADGSTAELNARSQLHTDFRYGRRTVELAQGEAYFAVAKDQAHPFLVHTPGGTIRVTGTQFNVRLGEGGAVEVTLLEGSVQIEPEAAPQATGFKSRVSLVPGQQADSDRPGLRTLSATELENTLAWRSGYLALDGLSLAEAAARFAAYHGKPIRVRSEVAELRLGGSCPLNDLPGFFEFVRESAHVQVHTDGDGSFLISGR